MKKQLCVLLTVLVLLLCGCGKKQDTPAIPEVTEPETVETTVPVTQPETEPAPAVVITKHPTGETVAPGGKTLFIAHADHATSVTWDFLSPEGTAYSLFDTTERNPGLVLDASAQDILTLVNIPLSLNGWSVRARFDGPGGSAMTDPACVTVKQSLGPYDAVIAQYQQAISKTNREWNPSDEFGVSEMILYAAHAGYALLDLDGNGVEELIIAGIDYDIPEDPYVFELFTIQDGAAVSVFQARARNRLFLMNDGKLYNEGSGGAAHSYFSVLQLSGSELRFLNGLYTTDTLADGSESPYLFYYTTSNPYGYADQMEMDNGMDEKVAQTFLNSWRDQVYLPSLCFIA